MYWVNGFNETRMYCVLPLIWTNATVFSISRAVLNSNTVRSANSSFPSYKLLIFFRFIISCFKASPFHTKMQCFQCFCKAAISYPPSWPHAAGKWTTVGSFPWPFPFIHLFLISSEPVIYPLWLAQRLHRPGNLFFFFLNPHPPTPDGSDFSLSCYNHRTVPLDSSYGNFHCLYWIFSYPKCSILLFLDYMYFRAESVFISCTACSCVHSMHKQI